MSIVSQVSDVVHGPLVTVLQIFFNLCVANLYYSNQFFVKFEISLEGVLVSVGHF